MKKNSEIGDAGNPNDFDLVNLDITLLSIKANYSYFFW